jgi:glycosyltransferase involved in cell wall biosynthesis
MIKNMETIDQALVSIIMPTYNRPDTIGAAIESILRQRYKNWELLIIDNGTGDAIKNVVENYMEKDGRVKYSKVAKSHNAGISDYLNYGISMAKGEYIARLDDDDEWCNDNKLIKQVEFLDNNKEYNIVGGGIIVVDGNKKEMYRIFKRETDTEIRKKALYACPFIHITVMFRKKIVKQYGAYQNLKFGEDWELWLRLGKTGKFYNFKEYFSIYTNAGQNFSANNQKLVGKTILSLIKKYRNDYPNYKKAFVLNLFQYLYSFSPSFIKNKSQNFLFYIKRNYF